MRRRVALPGTGARRGAGWQVILRRACPGTCPANARKEGTERRQASFAHKDALELVRFVNDLRFGTELLGQLPLIVSFPSQIQDKHSPLSQRVVDLVEICAHRIVKSP